MTICMVRQLLNVRFFFFQAEDGIRDTSVTGVQTCALPISANPGRRRLHYLLSKDRAGFLHSKCMFGLQSLGALALGTVFLCCSGAIYPLRAQTAGTPDQESDTLRGTVVNSLTHEPIGRALV